MRLFVTKDKYLVIFAFFLAFSSALFICSNAKAEVILNTKGDLELEADKSLDRSNSENITCTDHPQIAEQLLAAGKKLGVNFIIGEPLLEGKDATYQALPGKLGTITMSNRTMSPEVKCQLISHEFIHVLQHLNGGLKAVDPLGWELQEGSLKRFISLQEAEAYSNQNQASKVLILLLKELEK